MQREREERDGDDQQRRLPVRVPCVRVHRRHRGSIRLLLHGHGLHSPSPWFPSSPVVEDNSCHNARGGGEQEEESTAQVC
jgi:hypothetical protein